MHNTNGRDVLNTNSTQVNSGICFDKYQHLFEWMCYITKAGEWDDGLTTKKRTNHYECVDAAMWSAGICVVGHWLDKFVIFHNKRDIVLPIISHPSPCQALMRQSGGGVQHNKIAQFVLDDL